MPRTARRLDARAVLRPCRYRGKRVVKQQDRVDAVAGIASSWTSWPGAARRQAKALLLLLCAGLAPGAMAANLSVSQLSDSTSGWLRSDGTASGTTSSDPAPVGAIVVYDVTLSNSDTVAASNVAAIFDLPTGTRSTQLPTECTAETATPDVCRTSTNGQFLQIFLLPH